MRSHKSSPGRSQGGRRGQGRSLKNKEEYLVKSVANALDILEAFTGSQAELGVTELGKRLNLHKNNVFRLLATLEMRGYIEQNRATENYRLGLKPLELGKAFQRHCELTLHGRETLQAAAELTGETASLGVLRGDKVIYIDVVETSRSVRVASRLGAVLPAYCTSIGKVLMAFRSREEIEAYLEKTPLTACTPQTITDPQVLLHQLSQVRRQGFAVDREEYEESVRCVAAAVRDYNGGVVAGISLSGPAQRLPEERLREELIPAVLKAAQGLSRRLGYDAS